MSELRSNVVPSSAKASQPPSFLFVGNSHTYQPKELGGIPGAFARLAGAYGQDVSTFQVTQGGADLADLWEEFEQFMQRSSKDGVVFGTVVLQVGKGSGEGRFVMAEVLRPRYAPLLLEQPSKPPVVLYQTWSTPWPQPSEADELDASLQEYHSVLLSAGIKEVVLAKAGHAFLHVKLSDSVHIYPALWKDDMGHGSALAGVLVAAVLALALKLTEGERLGRILEAMLPNAWRTASPGFAGAAEFGQKAWRNEGKAAPAAVMNLVNDEEDLPLNKYPPGMRTERRDLPFLGDVVAAAAVAVFDRTLSAKPDAADSAPTSSQGGYQAGPKESGSKARRWQKK